LLEIGYLVNMLNILLQKATSAGTEYHMYYFQKYKLLIDKLKNQDSVIYEKMAIYGDTDPDVQFLKITIPKLN